MNDRVDDGATDARPFELDTRVNSRLRVTGGERATVLRLQQIDVATACDVERMTGGADEGAIAARQRLAASAHAAGKN